MPAELNPNQRFVVEAREHLARMTRAIMALEQAPSDSAAHLQEIYRAAHSLKGEAGFSGFGNIERLTHAMESVVENIRDGVVAANSPVVDTLLQAIDVVGSLVDDALHSNSVDISEALDRLGAIPSSGTTDGRTDGLATAGRAVRKPNELQPVGSIAEPSEFPISHHVIHAWRHHTAFLYGIKLDWFECERGFHIEPLDVVRRLQQVGVVLDSRMELSGPALTDGLPTAPLWYWAILSSELAPADFARQLGIPCAAIVKLENIDNGPRTQADASDVKMRTPAPPSSLRIPITLIDRMLGLAGELVLIRNQANHSMDAVDVHSRQVMRRLDAITNELQDAALRMRMQPVGTLFDRFPRLVRDLARQLGKQIEVVMTGTEVELDKSILEMLADPLTHLVRNCCDHGIEMPDQRVRVGKPPGGKIQLTARQERGQILVQIRDNGRGLDQDAIKRKALQQGVRQADELDRLSERQLYDLILLSGFSTADRVTDLSGRGVGMDVVRTNLERIGGIVEIDSVAGVGATFTLRLPLTLAIVPCLMLRNADQRFALPQRDVEEIVRVSPTDPRSCIECSHDEELLRLRGGLLPLARLGEVLGRRQPHNSATRAEIIAHFHHPSFPVTTVYVVVARVGSERFGLIVDDVLGSEEIVVKPLHPLLRSLGVYTGATILGDGGVALILSVEGLARHSGVSYHSVPESALQPAMNTIEPQSLMVFRHGASELMAIPLSCVRRVVRVESDRIERVGDRELINVDGAAINVLRLDQFLSVSECRRGGTNFLILLRIANAPVGLLASEIVDTPNLTVNMDRLAYQADGVLGTAMIHGQIALIMDIQRLIEMWNLSHGNLQPALPGLPSKRILVVEDTQFFQRLISKHLEQAGYQVVTATDGRDGLSKLLGGTFHLVVSDIEMPVMDGLDFARQVRSDKRVADTPLLALTTLSGETDRRRVLEAGFDAHEVKFDRRSFLTTVHSMLAAVRSTLAGDGNQNRE